MKAWGVRETQPVSPSVAIPLVKAAYDEGRPELQELWARLIASAMDPSRSGRVRLSFISTLKEFDPLDALVLKAFFEAGNLNSSTDGPGYISNRIQQPVFEVRLSIDNLIRLNCMRRANLNETYVILTAYGQALLTACSS